MAVPLTREAVAPNVPIGAQIAEVTREIALRREVYGKRVREGKMRQSEADLFMQRMDAVLRTLEFMREHRETILEAVAAAKGAA